MTTDDILRMTLATIPVFPLSFPHTTPTWSPRTTVHLFSGILFFTKLYACLTPILSGHMPVMYHGFNGPPGLEGFL